MFYLYDLLSTLWNILSTGQGKGAYVCDGGIARWMMPTFSHRLAVFAMTAHALAAEPVRFPLVLVPKPRSRAIKHAACKTHNIP